MIIIAQLLFSLVQFSCAQVGPYTVVAEKPDFPGYMFRPDTKDKTFPAIVILHGSEGGNGNFWQPPGFPSLPTGENSFTVQTAKYYASLGYVTYALCYFDCKHHQGFKTYPPDELVNVDIRDYVYEAFAAFKKNKWSSGKKVAVWGSSRGAELTLLLAGLVEGANTMTRTQLEVPDAIISASPSDFVAYPFSKENAELVSQGLPGVPVIGNSWKFELFDLIPGAGILSEAYSGPTLITYWTEDSIWGPSVDVGRIIQRYDQTGITYSLVEHQKSEDGPKDFITFQKELQTSTKIFIKFVGAGHVAPTENHSRKFYFSVVNEFLNKHLQ